MAYEVEQRAKLNSEKDFERVKSFLDINAEFLGKKEMKSFLFREPDYLRIRLIKGKNTAIVTKKAGSYEDKARTESEFEVDLPELPVFMAEKKNEGYNECVMVHTKRISYKFMDLTVELNEIDFLGLIAEVEGITDNSEEIDKIYGNIDDVLEILGLKPLDPGRYQRMMDEMYKSTIRPVEEQDFSI